MKIMISQPMRDKSEQQIRNERADLVEILKKQGYEVVDTIFAESPEKAQDAPLFYLSKSIDAMSKVDGVVFMEGWENARGCVIEHEVARRYQKFIMEV